MRSFRVYSKVNEKKRCGHRQASHHAFKQNSRMNRRKSNFLNFICAAYASRFSSCGDCDYDCEKDDDDLRNKICICV